MDNLLLQPLSVEEKTDILQESFRNFYNTAYLRALQFGQSQLMYHAFYHGCTCTTCHNAADIVSNVMGKDIGNIVLSFITFRFFDLKHPPNHYPFYSIASLWLHLGVSHEHPRCAEHGAKTNEIIVVCCNQIPSNMIAQSMMFEDCLSLSVEYDDVEPEIFEEIYELDLCIYQHTTVTVQNNYTLLIHFILDEASSIFY